MTMCEKHVVVTWIWRTAQFEPAQKWSCNRQPA